jgi:prepilin-type N-terminal cleavage/methylation domain-containing protein
MTKNPSPRPARPTGAFCWARPGFTLTEVMFAIMILGVGLVAIATIFPVASSIQKTTTDEIISLQVAENAKAFMISKGVPFVSLFQSFNRAHSGYDPVNADKTVHRVFRLTPNTTANLPNSAASVTPPFADVFMPRPLELGKDVVWISEEDRSYPSTRPLRRPDASGKAMTDFAADRGKLATGNVPMFAPNRDYYWYPLFRRKLDGTWNCYLFIMRRVPGGMIPQVEEVLLTRNIEGPDKTKSGFTIVELDRPRVAHTGVNSVGSATGNIVAADIQPGSWVLDSAGVVHRVLERTGNKLRFGGAVETTGPDTVESLWYGRSVMGIGTNGTNGDLGQRRLSASPTVQIVVLGNEVVRDDLP